jgi:signal transduction histidine kinase
MNSTVDAPKTIPRLFFGNLTIASGAAIVLLVIAALLTVGFTVLYGSESKSLRDAEVARQQKHADQIAAQLETYLSLVTQITRTAASTIGPMKDKAAVEQAAMSIAKTLPTNFTYGLGPWFVPDAFNANEPYYAPYVFYEDPKEPPKLTHEWETKEYDYPNQEWFVNAKAANGRVYFVKPYIDSGDGKVYMAVEQSMFDANGKFVGILAIDLIPQLLRDIVVAENTAPDEQIYLLTDDARVLAHPAEAALMDFTRANGDKPQTALDTTDDQAAAFFQKTISREIFTVESTIPSTGWRIKILTDPAISFAPIQRLENGLLLVAGAIWIIVLISVLLLRRVDQQSRRTQAEQRKLELQIAEQRASEETLHQANLMLEQRVQERTVELERAKQEAEGANLVKSAFLASMSHELRTPLNAIINFTKFVAQGDLGPVSTEQEETLLEVVGSGKHLLNLINDVLDMSKIESGTLNLFVEENVDLRSILTTVESTGRSLLAGKPVELKLDIEDGLPLIRADRQRVYQVLLNVMANACKFTDSGSITMRAWHKTQPTDAVIISIQDSGPGIAQEDQALVFEAFKQTEAGLRQGGGTGLGMPISKSLAEAHGGDLWLESVPGKGATFYFSIPVKSEKLVPVSGRMERVK